MLARRDQLHSRSRCGVSKQDESLRQRVIPRKAGNVIENQQEAGADASAGGCEPPLLRSRLHVLTELAKRRIEVGAGSGDLHQMMERHPPAARSVVLRQEACELTLAGTRTSGPGKPCTILQYQRRSSNGFLTS